MFSGDNRRLDQLAGERLAEKLLTNTEAERAVLLKRLLDSNNNQLVVETAESIHKRVTSLDASTKQIIQKATELLKPLTQELVEAKLNVLANEFMKNSSFKPLASQYEIAEDKFQQFFDLSIKLARNVKEVINLHNVLKQFQEVLGDTVLEKRLENRSSGGSCALF